MELTSLTSYPKGYDMDPRLIVFALGAFAVGTGGFVIAGILPLISDSLGVSVTTAGQLVTVFAIAYAVCSLVLAAATGRLRGVPCSRPPSPCS